MYFFLFTILVSTVVLILFWGIRQEHSKHGNDDKHKDKEEKKHSEKEEEKEKHKKDDHDEKHKNKADKHKDDDVLVIKHEKEDKHKKEEKKHKEEDNEDEKKEKEDKKHEKEEKEKKHEKEEKHKEEEKKDKHKNEEKKHKEDDEEKKEKKEKKHKKDKNEESREIDISSNIEVENEEEKNQISISPVPAQVSQLRQEKVYNKRNSTSTLYIRGTVSNPDIVELLKCISLSIQQEIKVEPETQESEKMRIFDERVFPIQENLDIDITAVPQEYDIFLFIGTAFDTENLAAESAIMMRAYIDRLSTKSGLVLFPWNWRRVVLSTLILASKVWEEEEVWNSDFKSVLPCLTARDLNTLEKNVLTLLQYNVTLKSSEYAKYYFQVRSLTKGVLPDTPLDNETAELIEAKSKRREEAMSAVSNSFASRRREIASYNPGKLKSNTPAVLS